VIVICLHTVTFCLIWQRLNTLLQRKLDEEWWSSSDANLTSGTRMTLAAIMGTTTERTRQVTNIARITLSENVMDKNTKCPGIGTTNQDKIQLLKYSWQKIDRAMKGYVDAVFQTDKTNKSSIVRLMGAIEVGLPKNLQCFFWEKDSGSFKIMLIIPESNTRKLPEHHSRR